MTFLREISDADWAEYKHLRAELTEARAEIERLMKLVNIGWEIERSWLRDDCEPGYIAIKENLIERFALTLAALASPNAKGDTA